jgi:hypothetical protein
VCRCSRTYYLVACYIWAHRSLEEAASSKGASSQAAQFHWLRAC